MKFPEYNEDPFEGSTHEPYIYLFISYHSNIWYKPTWNKNVKNYINIIIIVKLINNTL